MNICHFADNKKIEIALLEAQKNALALFDKIKELNFIQPGITELDLNEKIYSLAESCFGVKKFWHKRIVRAGSNTICPYKENPSNLTLQEDDILFFDFGPVFNNFEADIGRTFVLGQDPIKLKLQADLEVCFQQAKQFFNANPQVSGKQFYQYVVELIQDRGWKISKQGHCGHLIGEFPHEVRLGENFLNYICPDNPNSMSTPDRQGQPRYWILEIHIVNKDETFGGFYEDLLNL